MPNDFGIEIMSAEDLLRHMGSHVYWEPLLSPGQTPLHYGPSPDWQVIRTQLQIVAYIITQSAEADQLLNISWESVCLPS